MAEKGKNTGDYIEELPTMEKLGFAMVFDGVGDVHDLAKLLNSAPKEEIRMLRGSDLIDGDSAERINLLVDAVGSVMALWLTGENERLEALVDDTDADVVALLHADIQQPVHYNV